MLARMWPGVVSRWIGIGAMALLLAACAQRPLADPEALRALVAQEVERAGLPGASFALLRADGSMLSHAVGWADAEQRIALLPGARMRIASVSKPLTAVTVMMLAQEGVLDLDAPVVEQLAARLGDGWQAHPGFARLSARHLLAHCGGFDRASDFDPMLNARRMAALLQVPSPPRVEDIVAWGLAHPPAFAPGTRCAYSNLGYAVLGRLIESVTGVDYETAVRRWVLEPADIEDMRIAASLPAARQPDEPRYHDPRQMRSVFHHDAVVALPDGGFAIEAMDAHGGWIASAQDLVRLVHAIEGTGGEPMLSAHWRRQMLTEPFRQVPGGRGYALGWDVVSGGQRFWHRGDLPGSAALLVREPDGAAWALLGNGTMKDIRSHERLRRRIGAAVRTNR
jgi:CubicO group peptidase (beta-lactamase class C family)